MEWPNILSTAWNKESKEVNPTDPSVLSFPFLQQTMMYGGALMAYSIADTFGMDGSEFNNTVKFKTCFYYPTHSKNHMNKVVLSDGCTYRTESSYNCKVRTRTEGEKVGISARTEVDVDKFNDRKLLNFADLPKKSFSYQETLESLKATYKTTFYDFILEFFLPDQVISDQFKSDIESQSPFVFFLKFLCKTFTIQIVDSMDQKLKISYLIPEECPEKEINFMIIYMIDAIMVCSASYFLKTPIYDPRKVMAASISHSMEFDKKTSLNSTRSGFIELQLASCDKETGKHVVDAALFDSDNIRFSLASQYLMIRNRSKPSKVQLNDKS